MRNLPEPDRTDARATLEQALTQYRYSGVLRGYAGTPAEVNEVLALYDDYDTLRGVAAAALQAPAMGAELKQALHDAYDQTQKRRRLKHLREQVLGGVELCPVCGIDPPTELDHVLPRSDYQALAIYVRNLVPLCHLCNHRKLAGFAEPGELGFVHAYFDLFPDVQFLQVQVELAGAALITTFSVDALAVTVEDLGERLANIHTRLELNNRYRAEVNLYLAGQAIALHGAYEARGSAGVQAHLRGQARYETGRFYRNHWRPTLLYALAEHDTFCDGGFADVFTVPADALEDALGRPAI
ncbi:HNH endonuclease [Stenotrophomonas lactitubi]|uniref:HNH endonuclease n=1 Tax=Stenotrophomonas lactitubi TaxID=2045214 RepID=UPI00333F8A6B